MGRVYTKCKDCCCLWRCDIISYDVIQSEVVHVYISEGDVIIYHHHSGIHSWWEDPLIHTHDYSTQRAMDGVADTHKEVNTATP